MTTIEHHIVPINLHDRSYEIYIGSDLLSSMPLRLEEWQQKKGILSQKAFLVTDENIVPHANMIESALIEAGWKTALSIMTPGEQTKRLESASALYDALVQQQADRQTVLIAVGGGVIGDLGGFVAATYARGIPFVQVPTSLLAHVDSSVGGKVGINHPQGKNLIGAFYQPLGVLIDVDTLQTLPERDYRSGLAEVIKYGVILDADFFDYLEQQVTGLQQRNLQVMQKIIRRSCELKARVVEEDEFERTGLRAVLNYGHTFAHAFEKLASYGEFLHGEAVAIGMIYASKLAERIGMIPAELTIRQEKLLQHLGLPTALPNPDQFAEEEILQCMILDKKKQRRTNPLRSSDKNRRCGTGTRRFPFRCQSHSERDGVRTCLKTPPR